MKTIHRYELPITDRPSVRMPRGAQILTAPVSGRNRLGRVELWACVDTDTSMEVREFCIVGTGNPMPDDCGQFIGTVATNGGAYIWHLFEVLKQ